MSSADLKICVVGPCGSGKTLICKLLAKQPLAATPTYEPTESSGVRIQQYEASVNEGAGAKKAKVNLWDCSGNTALAAFWPVLSKDIDGALLVHDSETSVQETELELYYRRFVQPHNLTKAQCLVLGVNQSGGYSMGKGLQGRLKALKNSTIDIDVKAPEGAVGQLKGVIDEFVSKCSAHLARKVEEEIVD